MNYNKVNWNGTITNYAEIPAADMERAWLYGDRVFESIRMQVGQMPMLSGHLRRMRSGADALGIKVPAEWDATFWENEIHKLNRESARVRIVLYRSKGGLYMPETDVPEFLIAHSELPQPAWTWPEKGLLLGLVEGVTIVPGELDQYKNLQAVRQVIASREIREKHWDEGLLLNTRKELVEAVSSNLFCFQNGALYTPNLESGCIAGVTRKALIEFARSQGLAVHENAIPLSQIQNAQEIFLTNAISGIRPVSQFRDIKFSSEKSRAIFEQFKKFIWK